MINGNEVMFHVNQFHTSYEPHYRAYVLDEKVSSLKIVRHSTLFITFVLHTIQNCQILLYLYLLCSVLYKYYVHVYMHMSDSSLNYVIVK